MTTATALKDAINRSMMQNETITVYVDDTDEALSTLQASWDGEMDYVTVDDYVDVWGWSEDTDPNQQEWRLRITEWKSDDT